MNVYSESLSSLLYVCVVRREGGGGSGGGPCDDGYNESIII